MTIYLYASYSDAELTERLAKMEAHVVDSRTPCAHLERDLEEIKLIRAELKFRVQQGAAEALANSHYDHDRDEGGPVTWPVAIYAMAADLRAFGVAKELIERHVEHMRRTVGIDA